MITIEDDKNRYIIRRDSIIGISIKQCNITSDLYLIKIERNNAKDIILKFCGYDAKKRADEVYDKINFNIRR